MQFLILCLRDQDKKNYKTVAYMALMSQLAHARDASTSNRVPRLALTRATTKIL